MLYFEQKLVKWTLNQMFNTIHNCKITRPTWNKLDSYWKEFFIEKRDSIQLSQSIPWVIVDRKEIEWIEYLLVKDWSNIKLLRWDTFAQVWTTRTASKALTLEKWVSARWVEKVNWVKIWDAFYSLNFVWAYDAWTTYTTNDIVSYSWNNYVSLSWSIWKLPTNADYWVEYDRTNSWLASWDPDNITYADEFRWWYLVLKLEKTWIDSLVNALDYIYFYENKSNLQWIATRIEYKKTIDSNNILVYIRWTNKAGSRPQYKSDSSWEVVAIYSQSWDCPIVATSDWVYVYNIHSTWVREVQLLQLNNIEDITTYNWALFVLNNERLYYSHTTNQWHSTVNIYPLDYINIREWYRLVPYGKMLVLFGLYNKIITPINWTTGNVWFVSTDLNFDDNLFTKDSIYSYMWILYMIKDNKELVKVNIVSINNIDYQIETAPVLEETKWLIDDISWSELSMCLDWKDLHILNYRDNKTFVYTYNVDYWHWSTSEYSVKLTKILDWKYYWDNLYSIWWNESIEQKLWFVVWTEDLFRLKQIIFLKIILGIESSKLDYYLDIQYEIWGKIFNKTIDLSNYPINIDLIDDEWWLWDTLIWTSLLGNNLWWFTQANWNIVSVNIWIGKTASLMRFTIRSKVKNEFIYGWSVVWYEINTPEVTELWYKH